MAKITKETLLKKRINPLWGGLSVMAVLFIGVGFASGWNLQMFLHPIPIALFLLAGLGTIWYIIKYNPEYKAWRVIRKYNLDIWLLVLIAVVVVIIYIVRTATGK